MQDSFFKKLNPEEEKEFRAWARDNYVPESEINPCWHPVVRDECKRINEKFSQLAHVMG